MTISLDMAQAALADLINRMATGEDVVITRDGLPVARLIPAEATGTSLATTPPPAGRVG